MREQELQRKAAEDSRNQLERFQQEEQAQRQRLASLQSQAQQIQQELSRTAPSGYDFISTRNEYLRVKSALEEIEKKYKGEADKAKKTLQTHYQDKMASAKNVKCDQFDSQADCENKKAIANRNAAAIENELQTKQKDVDEKTRQEFEGQVTALKKQMAELHSRRFNWGKDNITWKFTEYNPNLQRFSVDVAFNLPTEDKKGLGATDTGFLYMPKNLAREYNSHPELLVVNVESIIDEQGEVRIEDVTFTDPNKNRYQMQSLLRMVSIQGGCFDMGDTFGNGDGNEKPVHRVCLDDFRLDRTEVTQSDYAKVMGNNPSSNKENCNGNCPVEKVNWDKARSYCEKVGKRLPTEAEWEFAAREGGKQVKYGTGKDTISCDYANFKYCKIGKTMPVASFAPNALGIHDMSGNVQEWVSDWYDEEYYSYSPEKNPKGPNASSRIYRVVRGGSRDDNERYLRASSRKFKNPNDTSNTFGFRCARSVNNPIEYKIDDAAKLQDNKEATSEKKEEGKGAKAKTKKPKT